MPVVDEKPGISVNLHNIVSADFTPLQRECFDTVIKLVNEILDLEVKKKEEKGEEKKEEEEEKPNHDNCPSQFCKIKKQLEQDYKETGELQSNNVIEALDVLNRKTNDLLKIVEMMSMDMLNHKLTVWQERNDNKKK